MDVLNEIPSYLLFGNFANIGFQIDNSKIAELKWFNYEVIWKPASARIFFAAAFSSLTASFYKIYEIRMVNTIFWYSMVMTSRLWRLPLVSFSDHFLINFLHIFLFLANECSQCLTLNCLDGEQVSHLCNTVCILLPGPQSLSGIFKPLTIKRMSLVCWSLDLK